MGSPAPGGIKWFTDRVIGDHFLSNFGWVWLEGVKAKGFGGWGKEGIASSGGNELVHRSGDRWTLSCLTSAGYGEVEGIGLGCGLFWEKGQFEGN